jgi:hypothetical protein
MKLVTSCIFIINIPNHSFPIQDEPEARHEIPMQDEPEREVERQAGKE